MNKIKINLSKECVKRLVGSIDYGSAQSREEADELARIAGDLGRMPNDVTADLHAVFVATGHEGAARRWGGRGPSKTIRVDGDAAAALRAVPERDRRRVASDAIRAGVAAYRAR